MLSKLAEKFNRNIDELVEEYLPSVGELKGYVYIDNDGNGYKSSQIESRMNELIEEFNSIPEDYKNSEHVNVLLRDIEILDNLLKDNFKEEEAPRAYELLSRSKVYYQSAAIHKNDKFGSMKDFVQSVQNNIKEHKNEKRQIKNKKLSVPADVIQHDKKHKLSPDEWTEIEDNIDNIFIAKKLKRKILSV